MLKRLDKESDFDKIIKEGNWLVDFYADWCGPCRMLIPVLEEMSSKYDILEIDTDKFPTLAAKFGVMSIPNLLFFDNGKLKSQTVGYHTKDELENIMK